MLSTDEAVEVLATDPDARDGQLFDECRQLRDPRDILTICSSLVTIAFGEGSNTEDDDYEVSSNEGSIGHQIRLRSFHSSAAGMSSLTQTEYLTFSVAKQVLVSSPHILQYQYFKHV
jgi:hypothetical protein